LISPREIPFIKLIIPLICGILIGWKFPVPWSISMALLSISFLGILLAAIYSIPEQIRRFFFLAPFIFFFSVGNLLIYQQAERDKVHLDMIKEQQIIVEVLNNPVIKKRIQFDAKLKNSSTQGKILVSLEKTNELNISKGDLLLLKNNLREITAPRNPNAFDFKNYSSLRGIQHATYNKADEFKILKKNQQFSLNRKAAQIQAYFSNKINQYIPDNNQSSIVNSLLLGDRSQLDRGTRDAFSDTGALHVLAVSGLHVGIIYAILIWLLGKISSNKNKFKGVKLVIILGTIWAFTFITGASPSVVRASAMLSLLLFGTHIQRYPSVYNTLAVAAFVMLIFNPYQLFNVSFQLSFLALTGILFFQPKIYKLWIIDNWLGDKLWILISLGIAAQLSTFPISLYYFHQFPIYFWLSGIVVVPAATVILCGGLLLLITQFISSKLAMLIGFLINGFVWGLNAIIYFIQQLPGSTTNSVWPIISVVVLLYFSIILFSFGWVKNKKRSVLASLFLILVLISINSSNQFNFSHQKKFIVYHKFGKTLADYWDGNKAFCLNPFDMSAEEQKLIATPARDAAKIYSKIDISSSEYLNSDDRLNILNIGTLKVAMIQTELKGKIKSDVNLDYLILSNSPKLDLPKIIEQIKPKNIIIDGSNKPWDIIKWETQIEEMQVNFINIAKTGAYVLDLEN